MALKLETNKKFRNQLNATTSSVDDSMRQLEGPCAPISSSDSHLISNGGTDTTPTDTASPAVESTNSAPTAHRTPAPTLTPFLKSGKEDHSSLPRKHIRFTDDNMTNEENNNVQSYSLPSNVNARNSSCKKTTSIGSVTASNNVNKILHTNGTNATQSESSHSVQVPQWISLLNRDRDGDRNQRSPLAITNGIPRPPPKLHLFQRFSTCCISCATDSHNV